MLLDYSIDLKSSVAFVVQEWRRQRWNHVCTCPDILTAEREARYRHNQTYERVRVVRVDEDEMVRFEWPTKRSIEDPVRCDTPTSYDEYLGNV